MRYLSRYASPAIDDTGRCHAHPPSSISFRSTHAVTRSKRVGRRFRMSRTHVSWGIECMVNTSARKTRSWAWTRSNPPFSTARPASHANIICRGKRGKGTRGILWKTTGPGPETHRLAKRWISYRPSRASRSVSSYTNLSPPPTVPYFGTTTATLGRADDVTPVPSPTISPAPGASRTWRRRASWWSRRSPPPPPRRGSRGGEGTSSRNAKAGRSVRSAIPHRLPRSNIWRADRSLYRLNFGIMSPIPEKE